MEEIEKEIIILKASCDLIDAIVNNNMLSLHVQNTGLAETHFQSEEKFKLSCIYLRDFLSKPDRNFIKKPESYLGELKLINNNKKSTLNSNESIPLTKALLSFSSWLKESIVVEKVWLPSVSIETNIRVSRFDILNLVGDYQKHNFSRFGRGIPLINDLLKKSGYEISTDQTVLIFDELILNFLTPVVLYQSCSIVNFLNNIRWEIFHYLEPVYLKSYKPLEDKDGINDRYEYLIPEKVKSELMIGLYWDLMNNMRRTPYVERFNLNPIYTQRY